ncbi:MAG: NAD(P)/FAD-dependent oxidoreductase [Rhodococcus sp. (in: high G+C Gram-positive bacteria)]|uniref:phytoene desaturase family protein n=1 Tax=Rhodococcus sp. TaxID=1831 RepID=UPI003BB00CC0
MVERAEAVVVGAGLGGLAAAVTLAAQGKKTVVLEQHSVPGGYATSFQRGPYRFDAALHALNGLAPGGGTDELYRELGIRDRLHLHRLDPLYILRGAGREVVAHADAFRYEAELLRNFPGEAAGIRAYLDEALAAYRDVRRLGVDQSEGRKPTLDEIVTRYPVMTRLSTETWDQMMGRHVSDPQARTALGALWVYVGLPPSQCAAIIGAVSSAAYYEHGGWYPEGGAQAISTALAQVLAERGGDIRYGQLVSGFDVDGDRAVAVTTHDGLRLEADLFISNASAPSTMLDFVGRDHLPDDYLERVERPTPSYTTFAVYLGLGRDVFAEQGLAHELFLDPSLDADQAWQATQRGDWVHSALTVTDYTRVDPGCAPPGHGVAVLTTAVPWDYEDIWGTGGNLENYHQNPRYLQLKDRVADALFARAADEVPGLADAVRYREASTPLTNFEYTRNPHGAIEGYANTPANSGLGWLPHETPIANLFLAGAWTSSGGMNPAMSSGLSAARRALAGAHAVTA